MKRIKGGKKKLSFKYWFRQVEKAWGKKLTKGATINALARREA